MRVIRFVRSLALAYLVAVAGITAHIHTIQKIPLKYAIKQAVVFPLLPTPVVPILEQLTEDTWMDYGGFCRILNLVKNGTIELGDYEVYGKIVKHQRAFTESGETVDHTCERCKPMNVKRYVVKDYTLYTTEGKKVDCGIVMTPSNFNVEYTCWALRVKAWKERYSL